MMRPEELFTLPEDDDPALKIFRSRKNKFTYNQKNIEAEWPVYMRQ